MKLSLLALAFTTALILDGCKRTCENIKVGEAELSEEGAAFLKYEQGEKVVFTSNSGKQLVFSVNRENEKYFICQKITCDPLDPYKSSYCEYIESPQNSMFLNTDSILIGLTVGLQAYEPETDLLYEYVKFTISHINDSATASYISDVRFESPNLVKSEIADIDNFVVERSSIELNNKIFNNVLVCEDQNLTLVYEKTVGFAGFAIDGVTYTRE